MSEIDTIRWGDTQTLAFTPVTAGGGGGLFGVPQTKQLVHAHWRRPLTWKILVQITPNLPAGEAGTFNAAAQFDLGCGSGFVRVNRFYTFAPTAGVYSPITDIFDLPAQDIQCSVVLNGTTPATQDVIQESWLIGVMAAPITEPAGYTEVAQILKYLAENMPPHAFADRDPANANLPRWMPPGFEDGELRYR